MLKLHTRISCMALSLILTRPPLASAQSFYAGAGLGPTIVLDPPAGVKTTYSGGYGVLGIQSPSSVGLRIAGTETWGFLWLSADLTYRWAPPGARMRPYVLAGGGLRLTTDSSDPIGTAGTGVRLHVGGSVGLFGETRYHYVFGGPETRSFLLFTIGAMVGG